MYTEQQKLVFILQVIFAPIALVLVLLGIVMYANSEAVSKITCSVFSTQSQAQSFFKVDRGKYKSLDRDKDGVACESLLLNN